MNEHRAALLVSVPDEDPNLLGELFSQQGWTLYRAAGIDAALSYLRENFVPVLITERDLPFGNWKDLLRATLQLPRIPLLIVASRLADESLWAEVLNLGGYDVLCEPFQTKEVLWVLGSAWQFAERDVLAMAPKGIGVPAKVCSLSASGG